MVQLPESRHNTRQAQGSQFLQDRGAGDLFSQYSQTLPYAPQQAQQNVQGYSAGAVQPINTNFETGLAAQQAQQNYTNQFDNYLYNTSVANGLYNPIQQPQIGGNNGMGMAAMGISALAPIAGMALGGPAGGVAGGVIGSLTNSLFNAGHYDQGT